MRLRVCVRVPQRERERERETERVCVCTAVCPSVCGCPVFGSHTHEKPAVQTKHTFMFLSHTRKCVSHTHTHTHAHTYTN